MTEPLIFTVEEHTAVLTLNRPDKRNAFDTRMLDLWAEALAECQQRSDVQVVIITGTGGAFCAGGDIEEFQERNGQLIKYTITVPHVVSSKCPRATVYE